MPYQDLKNLRKNEQSIKNVLERILHEKISAIRRHGNATLEAAWLAAVSWVCWGWTTQGTIDQRLASACAVVGRIQRVKTTASRQGLPPLVLRLFELHNRKSRIFLVTNEWEMTEKLASELYKARWGVEVFFQTVKQSCQRSKLCCGQPQNVLSELNWTLLGIWIALFHGKETLLSVASSAGPSQSDQSAACVCTGQ